MPETARFDRDALVRIAEVLKAIEAEMRHLRLWSAEPPSPSALASPIPFCYDTLSLAQWLQWVFLPRMNDLLAQNAALPSSCDIWPLAEEEFSGLGADTARLLELIRSIDRLITARQK